MPGGLIFPLGVPKKNEDSNQKMPKRKFDVKIRKVGNSYVVTIPKDTIDRFALKEGDFIALSFDPQDIKEQSKKSKQK